MDDAPCTDGPLTSYAGITNLEERAFKFATRVTIDRTTVGGLVSAETVVSGAALDLALNNQACFKYAADPTPADVIFMSFSGLEESFVVSVLSVEYFHEPTGLRVVFESDNGACARTGTEDTPGPGCFDIVASSASRSSPDRYAAMASVKLPMDQCRDDFNTLPAGDCATKLGDWLESTKTQAGERKIFVSYAMAFGNTPNTAMGFYRRQEVSCANSGIYCNALIRDDAADNLNQCDTVTAVGSEITINQFTDLVSASLAVVGQPRFKALESRPPCIALDADSGDETVTCPAMLHDQCDGDQGVASIQHIMEKCECIQFPQHRATNAPRRVRRRRLGVPDAPRGRNFVEAGAIQSTTRKPAIFPTTTPPPSRNKGGLCVWSTIFESEGSCIRPDNSIPAPISQFAQTMEALPPANHRGLFV